MADVNFTSAATRHLSDARRLFALERHDNASYLAGYVVECSLKAVVGLHGLQAQVFGHRLVLMEQEGLELAVAMSPGAARYRPPVGAVQFFTDRWSPSLRYSSTGKSAHQAQALLEQAGDVWASCIGEMLLDGLIGELI